MTVPCLVGHRGYPVRYPENTLIGLTAALESGARHVEFDLQMTADKTFILQHDDNLQRNCGIDLSVFSLTADRLADIRASEPGRFAVQYRDEPLPRLADVINLLQHFPQANALVEIKEETLRHFGIETVMPLLIQQLQPVKQQCHIISFDVDALTYTARHSDIRTGYVLRTYDQQQRHLAERLQPQILICNYRKLPDISQHHAEPLLWPGAWEWMLYVINEADTAIQYAELGAHYIETDDIGAMLHNPLFTSYVSKQ